MREGGALIRLYQSDVLPNEIKNIFFTHLHSDHIVGFADILMTGWVYHRESPLQIYGPEGTKILLIALLNLIKTILMLDLKLLKALI